MLSAPGVDQRYMKCLEYKIEGVNRCKMKV